MINSSNIGDEETELDTVSLYRKPYIQEEYDQLKKEFDISKEHLTKLEAEKAEVAEAYNAACTNSITVPCIPLRKKLQRIERELEYETGVNNRIKELLGTISYEISQDELQAVNFTTTTIPVSQSKSKEKRFEHEKQLSKNTERNLIQLEKDSIMLADTVHSEWEKRKARRDASLKKHRPFFAQTIQELQRQKELNIKRDLLRSKRMLHSASALKQAIQQSRETMSGSRRKRFTAWEAMQELEADTPKSTAETCFIEDKEMNLRHRIAQIDARHKAFREAQSHRRLEIVAKLLKEHNEQEKRAKRFSKVDLLKPVEYIGDSNIGRSKSGVTRKFMDDDVSGVIDEPIKSIKTGSSNTVRETFTPVQRTEVTNNVSTVKRSTSQKPDAIMDTVWKEDVDHIVNSFILKPSNLSRARTAVSSELLNNIYTTSTTDTPNDSSEIVEEEDDFLVFARSYIGHLNWI